MLQCRNHHHGKSIVKRWQEDGRFFAIQRCRKCDVWERLEIEAFKDVMTPKMKREKIDQDPGKPFNKPADNETEAS